MKIVIKTLNDEQSNNGEYESLCITIDGEDRLWLTDGDPEDMSFHRDLKCLFDIEQMLIDAYNAGKNGESLLVLKRDFTNEEWEN